MDGMNGQNTMISVRITTIVKDSMNKRPNFDGESVKQTVLLTVI